MNWFLLAPPAPASSQGRGFLCLPGEGQSGQEDWSSSEEPWDPGRARTAIAFMQSQGGARASFQVCTEAVLPAWPARPSGSPPAGQSLPAGHVSHRSCGPGRCGEGAGGVPACLIPGGPDGQLFPAEFCATANSRVKELPHNRHVPCPVSSDLT